MQVYGHRGSPGFPRIGENTRTSFRKALDGGADGFELDVRRCGDGTIVVIHDDTIDRTTSRSGLVSEFTADQLSDFDVPTLNDILDEFGTQCWINIELKEPKLWHYVGDMISRKRLTDRIVISSFQWQELAPLSATFNTALLAERIDAATFVEAATLLNARAIHPSRQTATPQMIALAHSANLIVRIWTVNDTQEALRWRDLGADAVISDFPAACVKALST